MEQSNLTPMFAQYHRIKKDYPEHILFFRLGDFYEMFYNDALIASKELDLVLTSRGTNAHKAPMCGIPYHAAEQYISRLVKAGHKVAICEQTEDPQNAGKLVKRDVVRVITAGTYIDEKTDENNFIASCATDGKRFGCAFADISSNEFYWFDSDDTNKLASAFSTFRPKEIILSDSSFEKDTARLNRIALYNPKPVFSRSADWTFSIEMAKERLLEQLQVATLKGFGIEEKQYAIMASGALLHYISEQLKANEFKITGIRELNLDDHMQIGSEAIAGLELESLLRYVDYTHTPMGKRLLRKWIFYPLLDKEKIEARLSQVETILENYDKTQTICKTLSLLRDVEKAMARIACESAAVKDILTVRNFLELAPGLSSALRDAFGIIIETEGLHQLRGQLIAALNPDAPVANYQGKLINKGYDKDIDRLVDIKANLKDHLAKMQAEESKRTGIQSLKIGYNKVFGYYIEVTKANLSLVPEDYIRKQTLVNCERFITQRLKEIEEEALNADILLEAKEAEIIRDLRQKILEKRNEIYDLSSSIAKADAMISLAICARENKLVRPKISSGFEIDIKNGRHPMVAKSIGNTFVPNDTLLDNEKNSLLVITGPNMSGKSTYIRQVALITILGQAGSFVPAESAVIGIVDKIFTRIGAHDDLAKGQSTFMIEMTETANIIHNATARSLVILDEVGRGTSTFDGLSIAWAVAEHIAERKIRALFATHFHEIVELEETFANVKNYNVEVKKWNDEVIFFHKIIRGACDESYGIYVAKIAGIPAPIIKRSRQILKRLEDAGARPAPNKNQDERQIDLFSNSSQHIIDEIRSVNIDTTTPIEALRLIERWQKEIR